MARSLEGFLRDTEDQLSDILSAVGWTYDETFKSVSYKVIQTNSNVINLALKNRSHQKPHHTLPKQPKNIQSRLTNSPQHR